MSAGRVVLLVFGALLALIGVGVLAGGAVIGWAHATQRDDDGFFTSPTDRFESDSYAITSTEIDLGTPGPDVWWADRELATVRVEAASGVGRAVFVGIGPRDQVERYLDGVPHDEVDRLDYDPFDVGYQREHTAGGVTPGLPGEQAFWVARSEGVGAQAATWEIDPGRWTIVVMNADASRGVATDVEFGARLSFLVPLAIGLAVFGALVLTIGTMLMVLAVSRRGEGTKASALVGASVHPAYPVSLEGHLDADLSRWQWLVKWLLAIPHAVVLVFLWIGFAVATVLAFFAILFTGRYPRRLFDYSVGVLRWSWRVGFYASSAIGTDRYPPFTLGLADYPATLDVEYPERLSRGLVLVKSWLLAIPHLVIVSILSATWMWTSGFDDDTGAAWGGGLLGILVVVAGVVLLFKGRYPESLFALVMGLNRWVYRVIAYVALMTDQYPPFRLDQGPTEPTSSTTPQGPPGGWPAPSTDEPAHAPEHAGV